MKLLIEVCSEHMVREITNTSQLNEQNSFKKPDSKALRMKAQTRYLLHALCHSVTSSINTSILILYEIFQWYYQANRYHHKTLPSSLSLLLFRVYSYFTKLRPLCAFIFLLSLMQYKLVQSQILLIIVLYLPM